MSNDELKAVKFVASDDYSDLQQFLDAEDGVTSQKVFQEPPIGHLNPLLPRRYLGGSKSPIGENEPHAPEEAPEESLVGEEMEEGEETVEDWETKYHEALKEIATLKQAIGALETSLSSNKPVAPPIAPVQAQKPLDKNIVNIKCRAAGINCKGMKAELLGVTDTGSIRNVRYRCQTCKRMFGLGY